MPDELMDTVGDVQAMIVLELLKSTIGVLNGKEDTSSAENALTQCATAVAMAHNIRFSLADQAQKDLPSIASAVLSEGLKDVVTTIMTVFFSSVFSCQERGIEVKNISSVFLGKLKELETEAQSMCKNSLRSKGGDLASKVLH